MLKKILFYIFFFNIFLNFANLYAQDKIAFVDINFVFNNSTVGKKINKDIEIDLKNFTDLENITNDMALEYYNENIDFTDSNDYNLRILEMFNWTTG